VALPGNLTTITVTGSYMTVTGAPAGGTVLFTPSAPLCDITGTTILTDAPIVAPLTAGIFSIVLPCTDNTALTPNPFWYTVTQAVACTYQTPFTISLPHTLGTTVDMSALVPAPTMPEPQPGLYVISVNGQSGAVTIPTLPTLPLAITSGGTGATTAPAALTALSAASTAAANIYLGDQYFGSGRPWFDVVAFGADPFGGHDSTAAINNALAAVPHGSVVFLPAGTYKTSYPLNVPSGVNLAGAKGSCTAAADATPPAAGAILAPAATFTGTAVIILASGSTGIHISDLWLNCTASPASVDGIATTGSGAAGIYMQNVGIYKATGNAFAAYGGDGWNLVTCLAQNCAGQGFNLPIADSTYINCHAQSCTGDGWTIGANIRLVGCRADLNANGFTINAADGGGYLDTVVLTGCSTQRNNYNGLNVVNTSATGYGFRDPVVATACSFAGDGVNGGAGGGGYAGVAVSGCNTVDLAGTNVLTGTVDVAGGCPAYAISTAVQGSSSAPPTLIQVNGGELNAITGLVNDTAAMGAHVRISPMTSYVLGSGYQNGSGTVQTYPVLNTEFTGAQQDIFAQPAGCVATTMSRARVAGAIPGNGSGSAQLTSGTLYIRSIGILAGTLISNITFLTHAQAESGGSYGWYVLLDQNMKVRAVTANQVSPTFFTASTMLTLPVGTAYRATYTGLFYVGICVVATGMPSIAGDGALASGVAGASPVFCGSSSTGQTNPPTVTTQMAAASGNGNFNFYAYLS